MRIDHILSLSNYGNISKILTSDKTKFLPSEETGYQTLYIIPMIDMTFLLHWTWSFSIIVSG